MLWNNSHNDRLEKIERAVEDFYVHDEMCDYLENFISLIKNSVIYSESSAPILLEALESFFYSKDWDDYLRSDYTDMIMHLQQLDRCKKTFNEKFPLDKINIILNNCTEWEREEYLKIKKQASS
jgi:hypothetical protein